MGFIPYLPDSTYLTTQLTQPRTKNLIDLSSKAMPPSLKPYYLIEWVRISRRLKLR